jgi:uncharacterized protein (TIGR03086 family)
VHEGLTDEQAASHGEGWNHYLDRLVRAATEGDAGADEWAAAAEREAEFNAITSAEATLAICQRVLRGVGEADYRRPTPCTEFDLTQLVDHLIGSVIGIGTSAGAQFGEADPATLESQVATLAQAALEAWNARGLEGQVKAGPAEMPAGLVLGILSIEFLVHAWDFAQATGQQVSVSDALSQHVLGVAEQVIRPELRAVVGFADPVETGSEAGYLERLIAFTGRTPANPSIPSSAPSAN